MGKAIISTTTGLPALAVSGIHRMVATTQVDGISFIAGWILLLLAMRRKENNHLKIRP